MKNQDKYYFLILCFIYGTLYCQTHRFIYELKFKSNASDSLYQEDYIVTDVNSKTVKSFSYEFVKYDSINKNSKSLYFATPPFEERFARVIGTNTYMNYENLLQNVYAYKTNDKMEWKIKNEFKNIGLYRAQKAECNFGKRKWVAWFTQEIPLPYGPYKFSGLPGMILEVNDELKSYIFSFVQNINIQEEFDTSNFLENYYHMKPVKIDYSKIKKIKIDYYLDPYKEVKSGQIKGYLQDDDGNTIENPNFNQLSKKIRKNILDNNNPIDLNMKINYPPNK
ncbi:GLPGLI family protein [Riemerella columbina]|uniref:GLPGLI family protein n=1 Tax=Riemerella columbina TaxID=103810 RepID=UPI0003A51914|nr:GLPGLI family protein [Riemerella columbina]